MKLEDTPLKQEDEPSYLGSKFLCSVLVAPVKNENAETIMFIINYEDITDTVSRNDIKKFQNNRHQSFKLRLPSIRRDIRTKAKAIEKQPDPENPPIPEEAGPAQPARGRGRGGAGAGRAARVIVASSDTELARRQTKGICDVDSLSSLVADGSKKGSDRDGRWGGEMHTMNLKAAGTKENVSSETEEV
nr:hypothetical protein BaRGS_006207 [Batillaria attramentaria]